MRPANVPAGEPHRALRDLERPVYASDSSAPHTARAGAWYREVFNEEYLDRYLPSLSPDRTEAEVEALARLLGLREEESVLDLCCGHGRHAIRMALRGFRVTGLDLSETFLARAREEGDTAGASVRWVRADMREIPFEAEFEAAYNMFTAFGYLESDAEDLMALRRVVRALKPGGRFLMETIHRDNLLRRLESCGIEHREDGTLLLEERRMDLLTSRMETNGTTLYPDGRRTTFRYDLRLYTACELIALVREAGLEVQSVHGGLDGSELTLDSRRLVLLARKRS